MSNPSAVTCAIHPKNVTNETTDFASLVSRNLANNAMSAGAETCRCAYALPGKVVIFYLLLGRLGLSNCMKIKRLLTSKAAT
jgi:hypothetical protein